jgi:hypothetical protein
VHGVLISFVSPCTLRAQPIATTTTKEFIMSNTSIHEVEVDIWESLYMPLENHISGDQGWNGTLFETYGDDIAFVLSQPENLVWTWVDTDEGTAILSGYHLVNRIGYFVTEYPWARPIQVQVETYTEEENN